MVQKHVGASYNTIYLLCNYIILCDSNLKEMSAECFTKKTCPDNILCNYGKQKYGAGTDFASLCINMLAIFDDAAVAD